MAHLRLATLDGEIARDDAIDRAFLLPPARRGSAQCFS